MFVDLISTTMHYVDHHVDYHGHASEYILTRCYVLGPDRLDQHLAAMQK